MRKASRKRKRSTNKLSAAKKRSKKIKTNAKLLEKMSKPIKLYLLKNNDFATKVKCEEIKEISETELIFGALFLEFYTVLQALQKTDPFV